jgi:hypothetical protein
MKNRTNSSGVWDMMSKIRIPIILVLSLPQEPVKDFEMETRAAERGNTLDIGKDKLTTTVLECIVNESRESVCELSCPSWVLHCARITSYSGVAKWLKQPDNPPIL